ncbi:hypothetical protein [Kitasatospora sp. NPDC101183]|uniref:hypothetical protein n=1 Tax=Kitasatospora sp. NPDC101183 TaxID=3364100 RepID=UPI003801E8A9
MPTIRITALTDPERSPSAHRLAWLASDGDGTPVGSAFLRLFTAPGVLPRHRERGLALWMKAAAILHARRRHPQVGGLLTDTADTNPYTRNVNDALGYAPTHATYEYQLDL